MKTVFIIFILILLYILSVLVYFYTKKQKTTPVKSSPKVYGSCDKDLCGALDPVSDPKYNMQQIIKQSILLEEHLANKNKRCRDCITKHFLHIIGLAEEAQMLATNKIQEYPLISECVVLYNNLFQLWVEKYNTPGEQTVLSCCDKLRIMRKKLIVIYFFDERYTIKKSSEPPG